MGTANVSQALRPLRVAFLVNPTEREAVLQAIELATMLWGGVFNPIIPVYTSRLPKIWAKIGLDRHQKPDDVVQGYIDGFDPDIIVPLGTVPAARFASPNREVVKPTELIGDYQKGGSPGYGIGLLDALRHLVETEFKYVRRDQLRILLPKLSPRHTLFLTSVYGGLPLEVHRLVIQHFGNTLAIEEPECSMQNFIDHLHWRNLFPRRIGAATILHGAGDATVFCMDATNTLDVLDYWNLRARGSNVVPAPKQAFDQSSLRSYLKELIEDSYQPHRYNPDLYFHATVQVGRSMSEAAVQAFIQSLDIAPGTNPAQPKFSIRPWYPRLWDKWAREHTNEGVQAFRSSERETPVRDDDGSVALPGLDPSFKIYFSAGDKPRFANDLSYTAYGSAELVAEVLPPGSTALAGRVLPGSLNDLRLSQRGLTFLAAHTKDKIYFKLPRAEEFMLEWLKDRGWEPALSSAGRVAKHMLASLRGIDGLGFLVHEGVIKQLDGMASEKLLDTDPVTPKATRWIGEDDFRAKLQRILNQDRRPIEVDYFIQSLIKRDVIRLGLELHCPTCLRWLWRAIGDLDNTIECEHCLTEFEIAGSPPKERTWSYKPIGPFNVRGFAAGAYAVLLTLRFLGGNHRRPATPLLSFTARRGDKLLEADLAMFCSDGRFGSHAQELLFCECKTYDAFKARDVERMELLASEFPGCILVFAKLGPEMHATEKRLLGRLANRQRRHYLAQRADSPVLILTGRELLSLRGTPQCWRSEDGNIADAYRGWEHVRTLRELAEATQSVYLGLPRISTYIQERHKKKAEKRKAAA